MGTRCIGLIGAFLAFLAAPSASAQQSSIVGRVLDTETRQPVEFAQILLEEANRSAAAHQDGSFEILFVAPGAYTLKAYRIGYEPLIRNLVLPAGDTLRVMLLMTVSPLESGEIVVEGAREAARQLADAAMEMEGRKLRQNLGTTIAETLEDEPGISMRSMGPAPARPVLRGLGGERLLVLEDGGRTGDLSATSTDHAVVIDPLTAQRIEVIRGPAALIYGPNTLGGVVNVVRGYVPSSRPHHIHVGAAIQAQSVNSGFSGGYSVEAPIGRVAVRTDGSIRQAGDVRTPAGPLENTAIATYNGSAGASLAGSWGHAGIAGSYYESRYGIPGGFVGAHPHGVNIDLDRSHFEARADVLQPLSWLPRLEIRGTFSRYHHREWESDDVLGVEFGVLSYHGTALFHTHQRGHMRKGAFGVWTEYRDYAAGGLEFTPASIERTVAGFGYQDIHFEAMTIQAGLRYDLREVDPKEERASRTIGEVKSRRFGGISASLRGLWHPAEEMTLGLTAMHSLRIPGIEELYSEGPHLAAYSYEIGNPDLDTERGWGVEASGRYEGRWASATVSLYQNMIDNYIYPRNTGEINARTLLPIFQQTGARARMLGGEAALDVRPHERIEIGLSGSYVRGTLVDTDEPLPWIPPLAGKLDVSYRRRALSIGGVIRAARSQKRVGAFEDPTDEYVIMGAYAQVHFSTGRILHTVDLVVENLTATEYRDHLSRVKSVMPEPGRNVKLLYKFYL